VLILTGHGLNCESESRFAWEQAGATADLLHVNDLLASPGKLRDYAALMFIGGFSYGDHLGSGLVFAHRVRHHLRGELQAFIASGRLVMGVCNGFQIITKLGLVPALDGDYFTQRVALMHNDCGHFQNFWVTLRFEPTSPCVFTKGLDTLPLPIRHGEGKLFTTDADYLRQVEAAGCVACRYADPATGAATMDYPYNPNGSLNAIAGLCDPTGRVFGLMPHPEAYLFPENHPHWPQQKRDGKLPARGLGLKLFENAIAHLRQ
jgi:phosphoribosylformylglycinamidine synthase